MTGFFCRSSSRLQKGLPYELLRVAEFMINITAQPSVATPNFLVPITCALIQDGAFKPVQNGLFSLCYLQQGTGIGLLNHRRCIYHAPGILCLNHEDQLEMAETENLTLFMIQFNPRFIHDDFITENLSVRDRVRYERHGDYYLVHPFLFRDMPYQGYLPVGPNAHQRMLNLFKGLIDDFSKKNQNKNYCTCWSRSLLLETLIQVSRIFYKRDPSFAFSLNESSENTPLGEKIILYLHDHYHEPVSIRDLTNRFALNRTSLCGLFKATSGMTIMDYLTRLRIGRAAMFLSDSGLSISVTAAKTGFNDLSHFGRTFKKIFGLSPSDYRRKHALPGT